MRNIIIVIIILLSSCNTTKHYLPFPSVEYGCNCTIIRVQKDSVK